MTNPHRHDRYVRWQGLQIVQFGYVVNLFLSFAVASLGFGISLKLEGKSNVANHLDEVLFLWAVSALLGSIATVTRLLDFRFTAAKILRPSKWNAFCARHCGKATWGAFWAQIISYVWGAISFVVSVIGI